MRKFGKILYRPSHSQTPLSLIEKFKNTLKKRVGNEKIIKKDTCLQFIHASFDYELRKSLAHTVYSPYQFQINNNL